MTEKSKKTLAYLLIAALFVLFVQVALGGITRLTGSGLSMTEWKLIQGTIPPLNEVAWQEKFELYKTIPQYQLLNKGMSLSEFKSIFFWEWAHRVWGRFGFVFILGIFAVMGIRKKLDRQAVFRFGVLLFLYFCQGLMGWFMVMSGLSKLTSVSHYRLAAHLVLALFLFAYILWWVADLLVNKKQKVVHPSLRKYAWIITGIMLIQIVFGAFMSGLKAAPNYPSFPDMNGQFIPDNLFFMKPLWINFFENITTIQFTHRGIAYLLCVLIVIYWWRARKIVAPKIFKFAINILPFILVIQVTLGVLVLLNSHKGIPVGFGIFHQAFGLILLSTMLFGNFLYGERISSSQLRKN